MIFSFVIKGRQIWISIFYLNLPSWISWQQSRIAVWKLHLHNATFFNGMIGMKRWRQGTPGFSLHWFCCQLRIAIRVMSKFSIWFFCSRAEKTSFGFDPALPTKFRARTPNQPTHGWIQVVVNNNKDYNRGTWLVKGPVGARVLRSFLRFLAFFFTTRSLYVGSHHGPN